MKDFKNHWAEYEIKYPLLLFIYSYKSALSYFLSAIILTTLTPWQTATFLQANTVPHLKYCGMICIAHCVTALSLNVASHPNNSTSCKEIGWMFQKGNNFQKGIEHWSTKESPSSSFTNQQIQNLSVLVIQPLTSWTAWCLGLPKGNWGSFHFPQLCTFCAI